MDGDWQRAERIEALLDLGRYGDAAAVARTDLAHDPESATLHGLLAVALIGQDDMTSALPHARAAAALDPESHETLALLAGILAEVGEGTQAREAALQAVRLAPDSWRSHLAYAHALLFGVRGTEILGEAEMAARRAVELAPHEPQAHVVFGIARWRQDDLTMAETAFRRALALDPGDVDAQRNLASLHIRDIDPAAGAETLTRALSVHPQDSGMHHEIDRVHERVLGRLTFWTVLTAVTLGGFVVTLDVLPRQRAFYGLVMLVAAGAHAVKVLRLLPPTGRWGPMLPWRASARRRARAWLDCALLGLVCVVWFAPDRPAHAALLVLSAASAVVIARWLIRLLVAELAPSRQSGENTT